MQAGKYTGDRGAGAGREGRKAKKAALTIPVPLQVLRGGDPAEGQDFPADADGEGGNAHQGGPTWGPHVSAPLPGSGARENVSSGSNGVPEGPFQAPSGGWGRNARWRRGCATHLARLGSSRLARTQIRGHWDPGIPQSSADALGSIYGSAVRDAAQSPTCGSCAINQGNLEIF